LIRHIVKLRLYGGVRERVFGPVQGTAGKVSEFDSSIIGSTFDTGCARVADQRGFLLHFKFLDDFGPKVQREIAREQYWNEGYGAVLSLDPNLKRILREIRRRTRVVGAFPDGQSALNLAAARLRHIAGTAWSTKRYLNIELLKDQQMRDAITA
jgi:hypothetical protein